MLLRSEAQEMLAKLGRQVSRRLKTRVTFRFVEEFQPGRFLYEEVERGVVKGKVVVEAMTNGRPHISTCWSSTNVVLSTLPPER